jgi:hypothetical protein
MRACYVQFHVSLVNDKQPVPDTQRHRETIVWKFSLFFSTIAIRVGNLSNNFLDMANQRNASVTSGRKVAIDETKLHVTSVFANRGEHAVIDHIADADEEILVALGYKQEFKRLVYLRYI